MKGRPLKVLLADDVRLNLEVEKTFLQRSGFCVLTALDGPTVLARVKEETPDLVILDHFMPGMTGTQVCSILKSDAATSGIPVVITSAQGSEEIRGACRAAGADAFVPKQAGKEALLRVLAQILHVPERKITRLTVMFAVEGVPGGREALGRAVDLSEGGMCMEVNRRYDAGSVLSMRFYLPGEGRELRARGEVIRVQETGGIFTLGLRFTEMQPLDRKRLNNFIDRSLSVGAGR